MEEIKITVTFEIKKPEQVYESDMNTVILGLREIYEMRNRPIMQEDIYLYNQTIEKIKRTLEHLKLDEGWR